MLQCFKQFFIILLALSLILGINQLIARPNILASDSWYDVAWQHRQKVTIDNSNYNETFTSYPLSLHLNNSNFDFSSAATNGQDFRPILSDGTVLSYEIESWNKVAQEAQIWIKIPTLTASSSTDYFYIYYGNSNATDAQSKTNVWDESYRGVYHLNNAPVAPTRNTLPIEPISIKGDSTSLYIGSQDGTGLRILSKSNLAITKTLRPSDNIERLYVRDQYLAFTGSSNKAYVYDLNTDTYLATISGTALFRSTYIDSNGRAYFGESDTGKLYYVDIGTPGQNSVTIGTDDIRDIDREGSQLILGNNNNKVYLVNATTFALEHTFTDSGNSVEVAKMDSEFIWFGSDYQKVWIKSRNSPYTTLATLHGPTNDITHVDYDNGYWFVSSDDGNLYIYDATSYQLKTILDGGNGSGIEEFWLDKPNEMLYFVRGHNTTSLHEKSLYSISYANALTYMEHLDSTSFSSDLIASESATSTTGYLSNGLSFGGIRTLLSQKPVFNSGLTGSYPSITDGLAFYYAFGANFTPFLRSGSTNPYFMRYTPGTLIEGGYIGVAGSTESVTSRANNRDFEGSFSSGLASSWSKEFASHTYSDETITVHGGAHAQKITATANSQHLGIRQNVTLGVGKLFRFSAWIYSSSGDPVIFNVGSHVNTFTPTVNTWTQISGYVTAGSDTKFRIYTTATNVLIGDSLIIDDVVVDEITQIPSTQGALLYSTKTGTTNNLALKNASVDPNLITHAAVYPSSLQTQNALTLEAWVYPTSNTGNSYIAGTWANDKGYLLYRSNQKIYAKIDSTIIDTSATDLPANNWYHVVFTADGTSEKIYVNGTSYVSESNSATLPPLANHFTLGLSPLDKTMPFAGKLDEVRVSETARSSNFIAATYNHMLGNNLTINTFETYVTPSTPAPSSSTTSSSENSNQPLQSCDAIPPFAPFIYSAESSKPDSLTLYFASPSLEFGNYSLEYGDKSYSYSWGVLNFGDRYSRTLTIDHLIPNSSYFFRLRSNNGCISSPWSLEYRAQTRPYSALHLAQSRKFSAIKDHAEKVPPAIPVPSSPQPSQPAQQSPTNTPLQQFKNFVDYLYNLIIVSLSRS